MDEGPSMTSRVGTFFLLTGAFYTLLFVASDAGEKTNFGYFLLAMLGLGLGWAFKRSAWKAQPGSGARFAGIRKILQKIREGRAKREAAKKAPKK